MAKVAVDNSALLERLIFAYDGTNYRVVKCDASGNIVAGLVAGSTIEVTQADPADLKATVTLAADQNVQSRAYGWVSGAWQKNPLALGISGSLGYAYDNLALPAGASQFVVSTTPAGQVDVITRLAVRVVSATITSVTLLGVLNSVGGILLYKAAPATGAWSYEGAFMPMWPADTIQVQIAGATLNDDVSVRVDGYYVDSDQ
jgi:hypothetical protein